MSDILPAREYGQSPGGQRIDLLTGTPYGAPFTWESSYNSFGDVPNPSVGLGYNYGSGGGQNKPLRDESSMYWMVEGNYDRTSAGIPDAVMEQYWEATSKDGSMAWRPIFTMADKSATGTDRDTFIKALDFTGPSMTGGGTGTTGGIRFFAAKDGAGLGGNDLTYTFKRGILEMQGFSEYDTQIKVGAGATKNAQLQLGSGGVDNVLNLGTDAKNVGHLYIGSPAAEMRFTAVNDGKALAVGINAGSRSYAVMDVDLNGTAPWQVGLNVRQQAGNTGNLLQIENSAGATVSGFDRSGYFFTQLNAAPNPSDVRAGEASFWFDSTAGASRMVVTARDSGGTVVTGAIPLTPTGSTSSTALTSGAQSYDPVDGANVLSLGSGNDTVSGLETRDLILGNGGDDILYGNGGDDLLFGGAGNDQLFGGAGNDVLWGNAANDLLTGGSGADTFAFAQGSGNDRVTDFKPGEGDKLALNGQSYSTGNDGAGNLSLTLSGGGVVTLEGINPTVAPNATWFA